MKACAERRAGNRQERLSQTVSCAVMTMCTAHKPTPISAARRDGRWRPGRGQPAASLEHEGGGQAPEQPAADVPREDAQERVPVAEHRQINLRRPGDADRGSRAAADERHPSLVELQRIAGVAVVVRLRQRTDHGVGLPYAGRTVGAKPMQRTAGAWLRMAAGCREPRSPSAAPRDIIRTQ